MVLAVGHGDHDRLLVAASPGPAENSNSDQQQLNQVPTSPHSMSDSDPPTAASILSALLLTPTAFLQTPTLASLRATLNSHNPNLSAQTNDHNLRLALKHVIRHRRKVVDQVEERIGSYRLLPKEVKGKGKGKGKGRGGGGKVEEDDGFNADVNSPTWPDDRSHLLQPS